MGLLSLIKKLRRISSYEQARSSYCGAQFRNPSEIGSLERAQAVLEGLEKDLLCQVLGYDKMRRISAVLYPKKFRELLPTTENELKAFVLSSGLPRRLAQYKQYDPDSCFGNDSDTWIYPRQNGIWCVTQIDERDSRYDNYFTNKLDAELHVLSSWVHVFNHLLADKNKRTTGE